MFTFLLKLMFVLDIHYYMDSLRMFYDKDIGFGAS